MSIFRWMTLAIMVLVMVVFAVMVRFAADCHDDGGNFEQTKWFYSCEGR